MSIAFRKATLEDGREVIHNLREEQRRTLDKLGIEPLILLEAIFDSSSAETVLINDQVAAVFGVTHETLIGEAKIWLITTNLIEKEPVGFLRASRIITEELFMEHGPLIGMVDADFEKSQRWLRWVGFKEVRSGNFKRMRYDGGT